MRTQNKNVEFIKAFGNLAASICLELVCSKAEEQWSAYKTPQFKGFEDETCNFVAQRGVHRG